MAIGITLSDIKGSIDDSMFKALEKVTAEGGYGVIRRDYINNPNGYKTAMEAIRTAKGFVVDLYGDGSQQDKGTKSVPRIVIQGQRFLEGDIGGQVEPQYIKGTDNNYTQEIHSSLASNYSMDIHLVYSTAKQGRILHAILGQCLGKRNYIKLYDEQTNTYSETQRYFARQISFNDLSDASENLTEKIYTYEIPDVYEDGGEVLRDSIKPVTNISVDIEDINGGNKLDEIAIVNP